MDTILQILQWAIPSGGIGAAIAWIFKRKAMAAKTAKEVHDTYKSMYEDISRLLLETQRKYEETTGKIDELGSENGRIKRALDRLSRAIEAIQVCPHRTNCPVNRELSDESCGKRKSQKRLTDRKPHTAKQDDAGGGNDGGDDGDSHGGDRESGDTPDEPP